MRPPEPVIEAWGEWIASIGEWHVFGGLTYDPRKVLARPNDATVRRHVREWLGRTPGHPSVFVEAAVVAIEHHKSEWPHCHPLLRVSGGLAPGTIRDLGQAWFQRHGWADLERPKAPRAVAEYAAKYLSKDLGRGDVLFWPPAGPIAVHQLGLTGR